MGIDAIKACNINAMPQFKGNSAAATTSKPETKENGNACQIEEEFGDLLFSIINLSRFLKINAENSLTNATNKFINRFVSIEVLAELENKQFNELSIEEMNVLWERVK